MVKRPLIEMTLNIENLYNTIANQKNFVSQDDKGYFQFNQDEYVYDYRIDCALGQGSFGRVVKVEKNGKFYALKVCRAQDYFIKAMEKEVEIYTEIAEKCPQMAAGWVESFKYGQHVCHVTELFDSTLYTKMKRFDFSLPDLRKFAAVFGQWLVNMEKLQIVHTDLKPENMVINGVSPENMRLIDYGSSERVRSSGMPQYVCSRFYRSPDITFRFGYGTAHDCWSIGALLIEMHTGKLMTPANSTPMLMMQFISLLGLPDARFVMKGVDIRDKVSSLFVKASKSYWRGHSTVLESYGISEKSPFYPSSEVLNTATTREQCKPRSLKDIIKNPQYSGTDGNKENDYAQFFELVSHLIVYDPKERWTGQDILNSAFVRNNDSITPSIV